MKMLDMKSLPKEFWETVGKRYDRLNEKEKQFIIEKAGFNAEQRKVFNATIDTEYIDFQDLAEQLNMPLDKFKKIRKFVSNKMHEIISGAV